MYQPTYSWQRPLIAARQGKSWISITHPQPMPLRWLRSGCPAGPHTSLHTSHRGCKVGLTYPGLTPLLVKEQVWGLLFCMWRGDRRRDGHFSHTWYQMLARGVSESLLEASSVGHGSTGQRCNLTHSCLELLAEVHHRL